ncbi:DUF3221 domain-containing protein [Neobacillus sp. WH10]|uniref:DUF3221 domain-containing protein n=1 Tax=Neobacillus sp. WH10 TaxID=3047873 RepID=UPI0024C107F4|nr:DUF3221 domain-containing protein [Neobacillus sp. WH10]WHY78442.1 DUF3221 domain-containing protein [Neobacillus sp. WH10]
MKKQLFLLLFVCILLAGCSGKEEAIKGEIDLKGIITEIDQAGNRILMEEKNKGLIWVSLPESGNIHNYATGQEIVVWVDGEIKESWPAKAKALNIEQTQK